MWISENRERREMKQRTEVLTPPTDIVISSFSHHTEEEGNNAQRTRSTHWEQLDLLFKQREEREKSKSREMRTSRDAVKDIDSRGDKVAYQKRLYSSLPLYYLFTSVMQNMHQHDTSWRQLHAWLFDFFFFFLSQTFLLHSRSQREGKWCRKADSELGLLALSKNTLFIKDFLQLLGRNASPV